jgi:protein-disulfide isomerase-like protein with CxxC motif
MPLEREHHENLLNELLQSDLEQSRRTEILQELRVDYGTVLADFNQLNETNTKLQKNNDDLIVSNSQLFRQVGITGNPELEKKEEEKTFSETITLESLEK